jgi:hypothetical protein
VRQSANAKVHAKLQKILRDLFGYRRPAASVAFRAGLGKLWAAGGHFEAISALARRDPAQMRRNRPDFDRREIR